MSDVNEARKNLEASLGEDLKKQYFALLKQWFSFKSPITKMQFDSGVRKIMVNEEQIRNHNNFMLAFLSKVNSKSTRNTSDKGIFEFADYTEFVQPSSPMMMQPIEIENRSAAAELFVPDSGFVACRIAVQAWENNLDGAEENVTELLVQLSQMFAKNILTAMVSRKEGYKIRDGKFQYGFGTPVPDPFVRNTANINDFTQDPKVEFAEAEERDGKFRYGFGNTTQDPKVEYMEEEKKDEDFRPAIRPSLEHAEQQVAFSYSCSKWKSSDKKLTVDLLYDTIREDPSIIGIHSVHSVNLLKMGLQLES